MRHVSLWAAASAATALLLVAGAASGQEAAGLSERGRRQYLEADFEGARRSFEAALGSTDVERRDAVDAHRYLAALNLIFGDADAARSHAEVAVALDPAVTPPEGSPPELADLLATARASHGTEAASLAVEPGAEPLRGGEAGAVTAELRHAPAGLVRSMTLACSGERTDETRTDGAPPLLQLEITPDRRDELLRCEATGSTAGGSTVLRGEADLPVEAAQGLSGIRDASQIPWWAWVAGAGGVAVVAAVVAVVVVVAAGSGDAELGAPNVVGW